MVYDKIQYSKEWKVLKELSKGQGLQELTQAQIDASLNRKINWFLYGGASGVISMIKEIYGNCLLYTSPSPRDVEESRMPSSA